MDEEWRPVPRFPGYEVSNHGRVRGPNGSILKPIMRKNKHGYPSYRVCMYRKRKPSFRTISRLVLTSFVRHARRGEQACHYPDPDSSNNRLDNLMWGKQYVNCRHRREHARSVA